jgi:hypothetical protein
VIGRHTATGDEALSPAIRARKRALDRLGPLGRALRKARARTRSSAVAKPTSTAVVPELLERLDLLGAEVAVTKAELAVLERRARDTQALVARTYEKAQDWPAKVEALRKAADYEAPYAPDPLVSVVIPTYNRAEILCDRALASLRRQTYENWEAIVVGDCCTDDTEERIRAIGDGRIRFENLPFRGPYPENPDELWKMAGVYASNRAAELASGAWIAPLDDDDEWDDDHLEVLLAHAQSKHVEVAYAKWRIKDARNGRLLKRTRGMWPVTDTHFAFQCAIVHIGLRAVPFDPNAHLAGEPGDLNRARRLWDAGVRFAFLDRPVTSIWFTPRVDGATEWLDWLVENDGYVDE